MRRSLDTRRSPPMQKAYPSEREIQELRRAVESADAATFAEPERVLGPFEDLSSEAREALCRTVAEDDRWRMAGYKIGDWHAAMARTIRRAQSKLPHGFVRDQLLDLVGIGLQAAPARAIYGLSQIYRGWRGRLARYPTLGDLLAAAGVNPSNLAVCYAQGIPQLPGYRGYWHDPQRHTTVGLILGIDLIQSSEGYWYIESNLDCGLLPERTAIYQQDPFVRNLLEFTAEGGYRRLIVLSGNSSVDPAMARQYKEGATARNLAVTLLEDAFHPRFGHEKSLDIPKLKDTHALVARIRHYRTNLDYVVQHKRASSRALRIYKEHTGDSSFLLPATSDEPCVGPTDPAEPFPNLVFKFPERDKGEGIVFLKAASASHAKDILAESLRAAPSGTVVSRLYSRLDDQRGLYQPYIRTPWLADGRLYRTRAHVLLTPVGTCFLSAHRVVCSRPLPEHLPMGIVRDPQPYLVNYVPGARFEVVPEEEEPAVRKAALGVARGLSWAISYGFETGPPGGEKPESVAEREARVRPVDSAS